MIHTCKKPYKPDYNQMLIDVIEKQGTISQCFQMFHDYSIRNQFLAYHQMKMRGMDISPINSFNGWNKLNRHVNRGEKALYLWQPIVIKSKEKNPKTDKIEDVEKVIFICKPKWFALTQTNGAELKQADNIKLGDFDYNKVYNKYGIKVVKFESLRGNVQGYAEHDKNTIALNPLAEHPEMTLLHEIAHIVLGHTKEDCKLAKDIKELEAETTAYIIGSVMGIDEKQLSNSRGYIQNWFGKNKIPDANASRIMATADKILKVGLGLKVKD